MDAYDAIARRTSVRAFKTERVPRAVIERLLAAAVRAPNHKLTEPWRFAVLTGAAASRFAELKRAHRAARLADPATPEAARAIDKTFREAALTPAFVVVMVAESEDPVRREEDYAATMMGIENLMLTAAGMGLGTHIKTGGVMNDPAARAAAGVRDGERIVAVINLGEPAEIPPPRPRTPASTFTNWVP